jgi:mannose-1-phosphate guanylyltransferase
MKAAPQARGAKSNDASAARRACGRNALKGALIGQVLQCNGSAGCFAAPVVRDIFGQVTHPVHTWALVLAGGEGSRLQGLTRNVHGVVVPKQFCSLQGGPSLLQEALQRAATVASTQRVSTVVAAQHRQWWTSMLGLVRPKNIFVQPHNRGTAHGILLPLLRIEAMDPDAVVVLLPADHHLREEEILVESLREAADLANAERDSIYLLGIEPEEADPELGYVLPASRARRGPALVSRFVEKPTSIQARAMIDQGALWNSFIMAASARALLNLFDSSFETARNAMQTLDGAQLDEAYQHLRAVDFSRDVLAGNESTLRVLPVPQCGWSDLGTASRVESTLRRLKEEAKGPTSRPYFPTHLILADQCSRQAADLHA